MKYNFYVPGPIVAKARPRVTMRGNKPRAYTPKKSADFEKVVAGACSIETPIEGPLDLKINMYLVIPQSWSKTKTSEAAMGTIKPTSRPDLDNYLKSIMDGLNGVAYLDDSQIVSLSITKQYARKEAGAFVFLETL